MDKSRVRFPVKSKPEFINELRKRVNEYFTSNNISKYGNKELVVKTIFMFSLYLIPYFLMVFGIIESFGLALFYGH